MKTKTFFIICMNFLFYVTQSHAQNTNVNPYRATIYMIPDSLSFKGDIYETGDTTISLLTKIKDMPMEMPVSHIDYIKVHKRGATTSGILIGGLGGTLMGMLIVGVTNSTGEPDIPGPGSISDETAGIGTGALIGFISGACIGAVIGSAGVTIKIHGKQEKYEIQRARLAPYSMMKR